MRGTLEHALAWMSVAGVVAAGVGPARAAAEPAASTTASAPTVATAPASEPMPIYVVRAADTDPRLLEALEAARARLEGHGVTLTVAAARPDETAAGRARALVAGGLARGVFWFDESTPGELRVFMLAGDGSAWVRRVPVDPQAAEATREAVWLIVEATGLALVAGEEVAMEQADDVLAEAQAPSPTPAEPTSPAPRAREPIVAPAPSEAPPRSRPTVRLGLAYVGDGLAAAVPWQSGAGLDAGIDLGTSWRLALGYGVLVPWRGGDPPVTWRHRVELRAGLRKAMGARVELYALVGGALEAVRWRASTGDGGGVRMLGLGTLDGGLGVRLAGELWLVLEPGLGVLGNRFDFVECAAGATRCDGMLGRVVLAPWRVRPRARMGLAVRF